MWDDISSILRDNLPDDSVDLSEIEELRLVEKGPDRPLLDLDTAQNLLELNLDALGRDEKQGLVDEIVETFESQHRLFAGNPNEVREATEESLSNTEIKNTLEFFDDYLGRTYLKLLEQSLVINKIWSSARLSSDEMDRYKEDIAESFVKNSADGDYNYAYNSIHLASAGYFNDNGYIRTIVAQIADEENPNLVDFDNILSTILDENPFLVMVGRNDSKEDIAEELVEKLNSSDRYRFTVEFVDGRAQGGWNREKLEEAVLEIQRDAETLNYDCRVKTGETAYRLFPGSLSGITSN